MTLAPAITGAAQAPRVHRARRGSALLVAMLGAFAPAGCRPTPAPTAAPKVVVPAKRATPEHPRDGSWRWQAVTDAEWFAVAAPYATLPSREDTIFPGVAPKAAERLVKRLEGHLAALEAVKIPGETWPPVPKGLPPLKVVLVRDHEANAFVGPVPVCADVAVEFLDGPAQGDEVELVALTPDGFVTAFPDDACIERQVTEPMLYDMAARLGASFPGCNVAVKSSAGKPKRSLTISGTCPQDAALDGAARANRLVFDATADRMVVTTGLLRAVSTAEWQVLPTLAHELGHYRMGHVTWKSGEGEYYFKVPGGRGRDPGVTTRGRRASQFARLASLAPVDGQRYMSALFDPALAVVAAACRSAEPCPKACRRLAASVQDGSLYEAVGDFPREELDDAGEAAYWQYEDRLTTCAARLEMGSGEAVSASDLDQELAASELDLLASTPKGAKTLAAALANLDEAIMHAAEDAEDEIADAEATGLARYTAELEADEFGIERFVRLGYAPVAWLEAELALARAGERDVPLDEADWDSNTCASTWKRGWRATDGSISVPPRGNLDDPHPYSCFRIWSAETYAAAKGLRAPSKVVAANASAHRGVPWTELVRAVVAVRVAGAAVGARGHALR